MLVLSRRSQESVIVKGPDSLERMLKVTVLDLSSGMVKLGFEDPDGILVHRQEVWNRIHTGGAASALAQKGRGHDSG
jgi:carbon storage regulator CsrA